jgi:Di-haem oxidoreductase, putative peroxidase
MPKLQFASRSKYFLASTALLLGTTIFSGVALAQAQTQAQSSQFGGGGGGFGGGGGGTGGGGGGGTGGGGQQATDPGVRGGPAGAGGSIGSLTAAEQAFFTAAQARFEVIETVPSGLGPGFNELSCASCHVNPAIGGSSPTTNPQVKDANTDGATNVIPSFITANGPIREARFVLQPNGQPDGGVHDLFSTQGRSDASGCVYPQPNFAAELAQKNVIFRIPTPTFGDGLVEGVSDLNLENAFNAQASQNGSLGISGTFNRTGNTGNITRFGWKAQNPSLNVFASEAYNVEEGVTNDGFPEKRNMSVMPSGGPQAVQQAASAQCAPNPLPEDTLTTVDNVSPPSASLISDESSDVANFTDFMRLLAPPTPAVPFTSSSTASTSTSTTSSTSTTASSSTLAAPVEVASADPTSVLSTAAGTSSTSTSSSSTSTASAASIQAGFQAFQNVGCSGCHVVSNTTGNLALIDTSTNSTVSNTTINPFSDFAVHTMGTGLADGVSQGNANGMQFRSAPLWGVGQRVFFLHDGRTNNLVTAIEDHASSGSEANTVIHNFNMLSVTEQQNLLNFLRNL